MEPKYTRSPGCRICFFDLPLEIRLRILGVDKDQARWPSYLNHWLKPGEHLHSRRCECSPKLWTNPQLLFVSRAVSEEYLSNLISNNRWRVRRSEEGGLSPLLKLPPLAWASLRSLTVRLNTCRCFPDHLVPTLGDPPTSCHALCVRGDDKPFDSVSLAEDGSLLSEWSYICDQLAKYAKPDVLQLNVICDTLDVETAEQIVRPMYRLPVLKSCGVRLGQMPSSETKNLAWQTVRKLTGRWGIQQSLDFPLLSLPDEIILRILEFTGLRIHHVTWQRGFGNVTPYYCCFKGHVDVREETCFCRRMHGGSFSHCDEHPFPSDIFLVSRKMYSLATEVFFSRTWFAFSLNSSNMEAPSFLQMLTRLSHSTLRRIRFLQLDLPCFSRVLKTPHLTEHRIGKWFETVEAIAQNMDLSNLTLRLNMGEYVMDLFFDIPDLPPEQEDAMWDVYQRLVEPLVPLGPFKNFYVRIEHPLDDDELQLQREAILERRVMGEGYDAWRHGKMEAGV